MVDAAIEAVLGCARRVLSLTISGIVALVIGNAALHAQSAAPSSGAIHVVKYLDIQPGRAAMARTALKAYGIAAAGEAGNGRVILLEEVGRPSRFAVVEKWRDESSYKTHLSAASSATLASSISAIRRAPDDERPGSEFLVADGGKSSASAVFVITHIDVTPPNRPQTEEALRSLVDASRKEPGALEFNVVRPQNQMNHFTQIEVWLDAKSYNGQVMKPASLAYRTAIAPLIGALYDERVYQAIP